MSTGLDLKDCNAKYVKATCNYQYTHKGEDICMAKDEVYFLLKKATEDWWQVIRDGDNKAFFAPRQYLEVTDVSVDIMKSSLRKKKTHQRHLQHQQRFLEENRKRVREKDEKPPEGNFKTFSDKLNPVPEHSNENLNRNCTSVLKPSFWQRIDQNQDKLLLDANRNEASIGSDPAQYSLINSSSLPTPRVTSCTQNQNSFEFPISNKVDLVSPNSYIVSSDISHGSSVNKRNSMSNALEKLSISSELDYSSSTNTSLSSLNDVSGCSIDSFTQVKMNCHMVGKAASFDALQAEDDHVSALDSNHAKAASSEELDQQNRRKEYLFQSDRLNHRNRSNSVDLKRFDNNLDLSESEKLTSLEKNRKYRITRDPMNRRRSWALNESHSISSYYKCFYDEPDASVILDIPPKLPPKLRKSKNSLLSQSSDNLQKMAGPIDIKIEEVKLNEPSKFNIKQLQEPFTGSQESISSLSDSVKERKPVAKPRRALPLTSIYKPLEKNPDSLRPDQDQNNCKSVEHLSGWEKVRSMVARENELVKQASIRAKEERSKELQKAAKDKSVEELIEKIESQAKASESKGKLFMQQIPPSPTEPPRRIVFDDWGEYIDKVSGRPYYYNCETNEKRWKPPRKSICSTVISESPTLGTKEISNQSVKTIKIPSAPQVPIWPYRERSFSSLSTSVVSTSTASPILISAATNSFSTLSVNSQTNLDSWSKDTNSLPSQPVSPGKEISGSPTHKTKSFFSSISSFMKHSSNNPSPTPATVQNLNVTTPPQVPPSNTKPAIVSMSASCPTSPVPLELSPVFPEKVMKGAVNDTHLISLQSALEQFHIPKNWIRKYDALSQQIYFQSLVTGEKWNPAIDKSGTVYVYSPNTGESKWTLHEYDTNSPTTPASPLDPMIKFDEPVKEDVMMWRFNLRRGKKVKKSWSKSFVNYFPNSKKSIFGKTFGFLTFSKKPNDFKKYDHFDFVPPCYIDSNLKKPNTICFHNAEGTEVLLQADTAAISVEWTKLLIEKEKLQEKCLSPDKEKRANKSSDKVLTKKDSLDELDSNKGIRDTLMLFFKKRIQQETLQKKGIYKDAVFGSTISDLCQEQLQIPIFVLQCIKNIEKNDENFKVDGLYRISGNASKIQKIRIEIAQNRYVILEEEKDVHNLTGALKLFFRELKEPLVPFVHYQSFIEATGSEFLKNKTRAEALRLAVKKIPNCNRETIKLLLRHLLKVNEHESENRMSVMNLAIVFGPCLMWPETASGYDLMTDAMLHNRVVEGLLLDFEDVFKCSR